MQVHRDINYLPDFKNAVVTIGTFDGVHTGHLQIINQLKKEAKEINGETVLITFHPHPRLVISSKKTLIKLLNTLDEKISLLEKQDVDHLIVVPFTAEFSEQLAMDYIKDFLVGNFHPHTFIIGYDHRFGKDRKGDYKLLEEYASEYSYTVKEIPEYVLNQVTVSSTKIREALSATDVETANKYLGYDYFFEGLVTAGDKIGRTLGYPTANLQITDPNKLIPSDGVYAVNIAIDKKFFQGMMSIGDRPTINGTKRLIEVNIFDFNDDIYNKKIIVSIKKYLRPQEKFNGLEELKNQLAIDKMNTLKALSIQA